MANDKDYITALLDSILVSGSYESAAKAKEVQEWWIHKDRGDYRQGYSVEKEANHTSKDKNSD